MAISQELPWIGEPLHRLPVDLNTENRGFTRSTTKNSPTTDVLIDVDQLLAQSRGEGFLSFGLKGLKITGAGEVSIDIDHLIAKISSSSLNIKSCTTVSKDLDNTKVDTGIETEQDAFQKVSVHEFLIDIDKLLAQIGPDRRTKKYTSCGEDLTYKRLGSASHVNSNMVS